MNEKITISLDKEDIFKTINDCRQYYPSLEVNEIHKDGLHYKVFLKYDEKELTRTYTWYPSTRNGLLYLLSGLIVGAKMAMAKSSDG